MDDTQAHRDRTDHADGEGPDGVLVQCGVSLQLHDDVSVLDGRVYLSGPVHVHFRLKTTTK